MAFILKKEDGSEIKPNIEKLKEKFMGLLNGIPNLDLITKQKLFYIAPQFTKLYMEQLIEDGYKIDVYKAEDLEPEKLN